MRLSTGDAARARRMERQVRAWGLAARAPADPESTGAMPGGASRVRLDLAATLRLHAAASGLDSLSDLDRRQRREQLLLGSVDVAAGKRLYAQFRAYEDYGEQTPYRAQRGWVDNLPRGFRDAFTERRRATTARCSDSVGAGPTSGSAAKTGDGEWDGEARSS